MATYQYDIAKAGWLYRQSSVLHRWKKNWFVLDRDGDLRYFESPDVPRAEERIVVRAVVTHIKTGPECHKADPPEGLSYPKASFLELCMKNKENMLLCAESFDDMRAWQIALEEARTLGMTGRGPQSTRIVQAPGYVYSGSPYMGYSSYSYPGQVISPSPLGVGGGAQVIHTPGGTTTVVQPAQQQIVYVDDNPYPYRHRRYYRGGIYPMPLFFW